MILWYDEEGQQNPAELEGWEGGVKEEDLCPPPPRSSSFL